MPTTVVVGAGWFGLVAARTYFQLYPDHELIILESWLSLGGTWSRDRVYRGLKTHNAIGGLESHGLPMASVVKNPVTGEGYITGEAVTQYLEIYAQRYNIADKIRYNSTVTKITRDGERWRIGIADGRILEADKLIMATGLTSMPAVPKDIPISNPKMRVLHTVDLKKEESYICGPDVSSVTVYGGSKSAFDAVYLLAEAGKAVDWIIRTDGSGVSTMFSPKALGFFTSASFPPRRFMSALSPSIYAGASWLDSTSLGRSIVRFYWRFITNVAHKTFKLSSSPNSRALIPDLDTYFWTTSSPSGIISEPKFFKHIHKNPKVRVHRASIVSIAGDTVTLSNGATLTPSVHLWATGWHRSETILSPATLAEEAGCPIPKSLESTRAAMEWSELYSAADSKVLSTFPLLREAPDYRHFDNPKTPYRLYRGIAPPLMSDDHSIAFVGALHTSATGMVADIQALWAVAYLGGGIELPELEEMRREICEAEAWTKRRYLALGERVMNCTYEFLPYIDTLLGDLGVRARRKAWWRDSWGKYTPDDYEGVLEEWKEVVKKRGGGARAASKTLVE